MVGAHDSRVEVEMKILWRGTDRIEEGSPDCLCLIRLSDLTTPPRDTSRRSSLMQR
jgi:hypothetical protein